MSQKGHTKQKRRSGIATSLSIVAIVLLAILAWNNRGIQSPGLPGDGATPVASISQPAGDDSQPASGGSEKEQAPAPDRHSDLPVFAYQDLPPEAHDTISLIDQGGPFPFSKDGSTFQNREGLLPDRPPQYYSEYTIITPGESDRGARRLVAGDSGDLYYTADHYASFHEVIR